MTTSGSGAVAPMDTRRNAGSHDGWSAPSNRPEPPLAGWMEWVLSLWPAPLPCGAPRSFMTTAAVRPGPATGHLRVRHFLMARGVANPRAAVFLVLILLLAASLRLYHLASNPPGLFCDEASVGLDAYSILHTAHDSHGALLPLF